jgi:fluoroacetyl-CoA thioesterase
MKQIFSAGSKRSFTKTIGQIDIAAFDSGIVHEVYATFAIARDAEWAGRLFVLEMKEEDEEGIGTLVFINHYSPALIGEEVTFEATIDELYKNVIGCTFTAHVGHRLIASGRTGQKILKKDRLEALFDSVRLT